jgi:hypothetical protein
MKRRKRGGKVAGLSSIWTSGFMFDNFAFVDKTKGADEYPAFCMNYLHFVSNRSAMAAE